ENRCCASWAMTRSGFRVCGPAACWAGRERRAVRAPDADCTDASSGGQCEALTTLRAVGANSFASFVPVHGKLADKSAPTTGSIQQRQIHRLLVIVFHAHAQATVAQAGFQALADVGLA